MADITRAVQLDWTLHTLHRCCAFRLLHRRGIHAGQPPLLRALRELGDCSQNELARLLGVSPATIAVSLKRMEKAGFIQKLPDPNDLRSNRIRLTEAGADAAGWAEEVISRVASRQFDGFSDAEYQQCLHFMERMQQNLTDYKNQLETE